MINNLKLLPVSAMAIRYLFRLILMIKHMDFYLIFMNLFYNFNDFERL
jgi:hypothetical protein